MAFQGVNPNRKCIAVTGASSFIGQHLIRARALSNQKNIEIRLLVHRNSLGDMMKKENVCVFKGDLLEPGSLVGFLKSGCTVINLVYLRNATEQDNLSAMTNLALACRSANIRRLVHCSTAVVVGNTPSNIITDETPCHPTSDYETVKYKIESLLTNIAASYFELAILRPTAVFGKGGKNLLKLAGDLSKGNRMMNYLKSCLFNHRRMNLVFVSNVVAALMFLINLDMKKKKDVFIISDDDNPLNNYRDIERFLMKSFDYKDYMFPRLPVPGLIFAALHKLIGKSNINPVRIYSSQKLLDAGFKKFDSFEDGLDSFANWYKPCQLLPPNND